MDTEVSPPHPEYWRCGIPEQSFSEAVEADAWMRDSGAKHTTGSHPYGDGHPAEILSQ